MTLPAAGVLFAAGGPAYYLYLGAYGFFAYGPQLIICLVFAWAAGRSADEDLLGWMIRGFLWSLLPLVGVAAMWWLWRRAARQGGRPPEHGGSATDGGSMTDGGEFRHRDQPVRSEPPAGRP